MTELASTRPTRKPTKPADRIPGGARRLVLATKVVPPLCQGLILRPRLLSVAAQLLQKRLAVVKAPAGFGKTSLVATWLPELRKTGSAVAWLTIDPNDDEPATFMLYVCHALQRACGTVGPAAIELIEESLLIDPHLIWSALINDMAELDEDVFLVLEDYHWILHPEIHTALGFFLRRAPSNCHVVLTSRTEPPLPLASLRAQICCWRSMPRRCGSMSRRPASSSKQTGPARSTWPISGCCGRKPVAGRQHCGS